jgi:hypothetical protein
MSLIHNKVAVSVLNNFATTSATTGVYVQLAAASTMPGNGYQSGKLHYYNTSGRVITLAYGAAGSEQKWLTIPPTEVPVVVEALYPSNSRLSMITNDDAATSGWLTLDFFI